MVVVESGIPNQSVDEAVLFAFDDFSIPFRTNLRLHLVHGKRNKEQTPIVLPKGEPASQDEGVHYYGTTVRIGDEFRMWYIGRVGRGEHRANYEGSDGHLCYAVSRDGVHWEKPNLGMVSYRGRTNNNLVDFPQDADIGAGVIIHDLEDPDPNRRFKINYEARSRTRCVWPTAQTACGGCPALVTPSDRSLSSQDWRR